MANDSNIDSWDLRQGDSSAHSSYYRHDSRPATVSSYDFVANQSKTRGRQYFTSNGLPRHQHRSRVTRSGSDARFLNSAIFTEPLEKTDWPGPIIQASCGDSNTLAGKISSLSINGAGHVADETGNQPSGRNTYRCLPIISSPTLSTISSSRADSKSSVKVRCCTIGKTTDDESNDLSSQPEVQRYAVNGHRVVEFSASSVSNSILSDRQGSTNGKKNAYEEWVERKKAYELQRKEETRRLEQAKQSEEERFAKEKEERERKERENFLQWAERKRKEEANRRDILERELELERRLKEFEDKTVMAKTIHLRQWARKKEEQQKALQRKQELRQKQEEEERKKRLEESSRAYEKWRETSKNRPRPATQGLLPHQQATPSYINPIPWVIDDVNSAESHPTQTPTGQSRSSVRKSIPYKQ